MAIMDALVNWNRRSTGKTWNQDTGKWEDIRRPQGLTPQQRGVVPVARQVTQPKSSSSVSLGAMSLTQPPSPLDAMGGGRQNEPVPIQAQPPAAGGIMAGRQPAEPLATGPKPAAAAEPALSPMPTDEELASRHAEEKYIPGVPAGLFMQRVATPNSPDPNARAFVGRPEGPPAPPRPPLVNVAQERMDAQRQALASPMGQGVTNSGVLQADPRAGGAISGTGILGRMARNIDPREQAGLRAERQLQNVTLPQMREQGVMALNLAQEDTRGRRAQGAEAAEAAARGQVGAAEAGARGAQYTAQTQQIISQADKDFRAAMASANRSAGVAAVAARLRADAEKMRKAKPANEDPTDYAARIGPAIEALLANADRYEAEVGAGGGDDGSIPTWTPPPKTTRK